MKKVILASAVALLLNSVSIFAQPKPEGSEKDFAAALDAYVRKTIETVNDIPGIAIVVIKGDKPIFLRAYGMADREAGVKADGDTLFYIASSTKAFTALAAAMLDQERKILFADPVTKYTTGVMFKTPVPDKITVRDLLTHTSGLRNEALMYRAAFSGQINKAEIARVFADGTTFDEANFGKYRYTNLGYNIYGLLLEYRLKLKWQDVLQQRIFDPVGLEHTTAYISRAPAKKWSVAAPYVFDPQAGGMVRSVLNKMDNNMQAAGGIFMSISDLGKWLNLQMNGGKLDGKQVMPADLIQASHTGYTKTARNTQSSTSDGEYGLGWEIGKYRNEKMIHHPGDYPGYYSHVSFLPDRGLAVGVLVNNSPAGGRTADLLARYAYDWWLQPLDLEANYAKQLQEFADLYARRKQQLIAGAAERAKRQSQLTQPLADYVGKYTNELLGTIEITIDGNTLGVRLGNLYCQSTPFTEKDTIRVVMLPGGSGEVIGFLKGATGKFELLKYAGSEFKRSGL